MEKQSKVILIDGTIVYFELVNTPIANFCNTGTTIIINNKAYQKNTIKSIIFGATYQAVTTLPNNFLINCSGLQYIDLSGLSELKNIGTNFVYGSSIQKIELNPFQKVTSIGTNFLSYNPNLVVLDLSPLDLSLTNFPKPIAFKSIGCINIRLGKLTNPVGSNISAWFTGIKNNSNCTLYADTLEIAESFKEACPNISKWTIHYESIPKRDWILKIFKSFNLMGNRIHNVKVDDPIIAENPVNKRTLINTTTYDTPRAQRFLRPFNFPWLTERLYGLRFKKVFDELFYPIIPYKYTNPKLDKIDFVSFITNNGYNNLIDLGNNEPNGAKPKHQLFYDTNNFAFKLNFGVNKHERPVVSPARLKIYDTKDVLVGNFGAINNNDSGVIEVTNQIFKPGYKIIFEKQYNASVVCDNTHQEPSLEDGFTNIGYLYREDLTAEFYNRFYLIHTPIIRLKTGTDALATDVVSGNNPPAGFTYNYSYQVNTGAECLFDILIPNELAATIKPLEYNMEINIRLSPNTGKPYNKVLYTQKLGDLYNQLHMAGDTIYTIGGVKYRLGYINLGTFEKHPVRIDFILKPY